MSTDAPFQPPRKKLSIFWWLGGFLLLLVSLFAFQLFGPNPPIVVSPQTTHITRPLGPDRLPDYEQYVLEDYRKGVTPENNAAALLWPALWPGDLDPADYSAIVAELGLSRIPATKDAITDPYKGPIKDSITSWLKNQDPNSKAVPRNSSDDSANSTITSAENDDPAETLVDSARSRPWTTQQVPPLAKWVIENQKPLDQMVQASTRPRCYFPSPSLLNPEREGLIAMLLPGVQSVRTAGRTLAIRAMLYAGDKREEAAWRDLLAVHRIGRLTAQGKTLVEQLVGMAIDGMAREATLALLDQQSLSVEQAQTIQRDLMSLEYFNGVANSMDSIERLSYLEAIVQFATRKYPLPVSEIGQELSYLNHIRVNWNVALEKGNDFYDRLVTAAQIPQYAARKQALAQFDSEVNQLASEVKRPGTLLAGVINPASRSKTVASAILALFLPATAAAMEAQDRSNTMLDLERLAAALAVYRIRNGTYPEKLDQLVPNVLDKLPVDLYNAKPFVYKRTADGYLLYTVGANGNNDGGSSQMQQVFEGRFSDELDDASRETLLQKIPAGADDYSIRTPRPVFKLPKPAAR